MLIANVLTAALTLGSLAVPAAPEPGARGHYIVLTSKNRVAAPFSSVELLYGPLEQAQGATYVWWQLEVRAAERPVPLFVLQALTAGHPLQDVSKPLQFRRYLLRIPETGEVLEYRNLRSRQPLLPGWGGFQTRFLPRPAPGSGEQDGLAQTAEYLGHVLSLRHTSRDVPWKPLEGVKRLDLDPELLLGTSRYFKDEEGHRLPQKPERRNYTYIPFTGEDYAVMIKAGSNLFPVSADQEQYVRAEPVFYLRGPNGKPALRYPADLYRSNYLGHDMFIDEPASIMIGDKLIHDTLKYFTDASALLVGRVRDQYNGQQGAVTGLERAMAGAGVNLGSMRLEVPDIPIWETYYETTHYQMKAGGNGLVHEGRYQLESFQNAVAEKTGLQRKYSAEEMLRCVNAVLRGGTRPFGKHWGTAIYGQCDPEIAPLALTLAYDMGARYLWFWTSDHDHHVPWPEQMELTRHLRTHAAAHPRPSIFEPPAPRALAIMLPYGAMLSLENLWWIREMDPEGRNESSLRYRRLLTRAFEAINGALDAKIDFDVIIDDPETRANPHQSYARVLRITDVP